MWGHLCSAQDKIYHKTKKNTLHYLKKKIHEVKLLYYLTLLAAINKYSIRNTCKRINLKILLIVGTMGNSVSQYLPLFIILCKTSLVFLVTYINRKRKTQL